eukprot:scaffold245533_cov17-Tisochrysis_lutea.AAC.1
MTFSHGHGCSPACPAVGSRHCSTDRLQFRQAAFPPLAVIPLRMDFCRGELPAKQGLGKLRLKACHSSVDELQFQQAVTFARSFSAN